MSGDFACIHKYNNFGQFPIDIYFIVQQLLTMLQ